MTKDEALDLALEVLIQLRTPLRVNTSLDAYDVGRAITAIKQALDRKAENARELGLDYEPVREDWGPGPHEYHSLPPAQPSMPDAIHHTDLSEILEYIQGWNDCRAEMLKGMNT